MSQNCAHIHPGEDPEVAGSHLESFGFPARNSAASETSTSYLDDEADIIPQRRYMGSVFWGLFQRGNDLEGAVSIADII